MILKEHSAITGKKGLNCSRSRREAAIACALLGEIPKLKNALERRGDLFGFADELRQLRMRSRGVHNLRGTQKRECIKREYTSKNIA